MERTSNRLILTLAILGGTGREGGGLAYRWAKAGYHVVIGSRTPEKAERAAAEINERLDQPAVQGMGNAQAADRCDIAALSVPYAAHRSTLESLRDPLRGKILIDVTVPIDPQDPTRVQVPPDGSAAQEAQAILGEEVRVVAAFHNLSHPSFWASTGVTRSSPRVSASRVNSSPAKPPSPTTTQLCLTALPGLPLIGPGDDLSGLILAALARPPLSLLL